MPPAFIISKVVPPGRSIIISESLLSIRTYEKPRPDRQVAGGFVYALKVIKNEIRYRDGNLNLGEAGTIFINKGGNKFLSGL